MTATRTVSPLTALLLVIGGLALIIGIGLGMQSHSVPNSFSDLPPINCGTNFAASSEAHVLLTDHQACNAVAPLRPLVWLLTIAGGLALVIGAGMAINVRTAISAPRTAAPAPSGRDCPACHAPAGTHAPDCRYAA